jgi:hypothetical protein
MKVVIFEAESRETGAFESLRTNHELFLTKEPLTGESAAQYADFNVVSTFIY